MWNKAELVDYLIDPEGFMPGTLKQKIISDRSKAIKIVNKLEEFTTSN